MNVWTAIFNTLFANEGEQLEYASLFDSSAVEAQNAEIQAGIDEILAKRKKLLDWMTM